MLLKLFAATSLPVSVLIFISADAPLWAVPVFYVLCFAALLLLAVGFLALICAPVDIQKPQHEDSKFYRFFMYLYIELIMQLVRIKVEVEGLERIPSGRRFLLVCNHQSEADPGILHHYFRKSQLAFISKKENATMPFVGKIMHKTLCQMVNRENDREALKTIIKCIQMIKGDKVSVCVFPEGGILEKDKLSHFRNGVFKIAQKAGVPIVICTLKGSSDVIPNLMKLKPTRIRLHLVDILPEWKLEGKTTVEIGEEVYNIMLSDLGEEYRIVSTENP